MPRCVWSKRPRPRRRQNYRVPGGSAARPPVSNPSPSAVPAVFAPHVTRERPHVGVRAGSDNSIWERQANWCVGRRCKSSAAPPSRAARGSWGRGIAPGAAGAPPRRRGGPAPRTRAAAAGTPRSSSRRAPPGARVRGSGDGPRAASAPGSAPRARPCAPRRSQHTTREQAVVVARRRALHVVAPQRLGHRDLPALPGLGQ